MKTAQTIIDEITASLKAGRAETQRMMEAVVNGTATDEDVENFRKAQQPATDKLSADVKEFENEAKAKREKFRRIAKIARRVKNG
jgi:hypothetical protein